MLTMKRVESDGHETVFEVKSTSYLPREGDNPPKLFWELPNGTMVGGVVEGSHFVMNEAGKTISKYWLGPNPMPVHPETQAA